MARASKSVTKPAATGTAVALIDDQLAQEAGALRDRLNAPAGNKIKIEPAGSFTSSEGLDLGDEIQIVVLDFITRHFYYSGPYNPNNIVPPDCYAMSFVKPGMAPEADSPSPQHDNCAQCPLNQFGTGTNGKSKACQNRYWLACLLVDPDNPDAHNAPDAPIHILDLSPSNLRGFEAAAAVVERSLKGPPLKAILTATARNAGTYASVSFSSPVPNPDYAAHFQRRDEARAMLTTRPNFTTAAAAPARAPARRAAPPARRAGGR